MEPPTRKHLTPEERQLVLKVENYFNREKENGGPLSSIMAVQKRTADCVEFLRRHCKIYIKWTEKDNLAKNTKGDDCTQKAWTYLKESNMKFEMWCTKCIRLKKWLQGKH